MPSNSCRKNSLVKVKITKESRSRSGASGGHKDESGPPRSQSVYRKERKPTESTQSPAEQRKEASNETRRIELLDAKLQKVMALLLSREEKQKAEDVHDHEPNKNLEADGLRSPAVSEEKRNSRNKGAREKQNSPVVIESVPTVEPFERYFTMKFDINIKRSVNPYDVIDEIRKETGLGVKLWTLNRTAFLIEAKNKEQSEKLTNIKRLIFIGVR